MKIFHVYTQQRLARPLDEVFEFFSRAENLETITPPWLAFRITSGHDLTMRAGLHIDYRLKLHGIPVSWQSEITAWQPPFHFVDEQRRGPYRRWHHEHRFTAIGASETLVEDHVEYASIGGSLANRWFLVPQLRRIFEHRQQEVGARFGDVCPPTLVFGAEAESLRTTSPAAGLG